MDDTVRFTPKGSDSLGPAIKLESQPQGVAANGSLTVVASLQHVTVFRDGKKISELAIDYRGTCVAISPNGSDVAVGGGDKKIYLYTVENDTLVPGATKELEAKGGLCTIDFSPDGAWLASGDDSRNVMAWETSTWECKHRRWKYHTAKVTSLAWSPDSARIVTSSLDTNLIVWNVATPTKRIVVKGAHPSANISSVQWPSENTFFSGGDDACVRS